MPYISLNMFLGGDHRDRDSATAYSKSTSTRHSQTTGAEHNVDPGLVPFSGRNECGDGGDAVGVCDPGSSCRRVQHREATGLWTRGPGDTSKHVFNAERLPPGNGRYAALEMLNISGQSGRGSSRFFSSRAALSWHGAHTVSGVSGYPVIYFSASLTKALLCVHRFMLSGFCSKSAAFNTHETTTKQTAVNSWRQFQIRLLIKMDDSLDQKYTFHQEVAKKIGTSLVARCSVSS